MSSINTIIRFVVPVALIYMAYNLLGPVGGFIGIAVFILMLVWFNRSFIYSNRANKKYGGGDFDGALSDLKKAVSSAPKDAKIRGTYAYLLLKLGNTDEAAAEINKALSLASGADRNSLRITESLVLWKQGRLDESIGELEGLLKTFETTNVYASLGFLYIEKGDLDKALEFNLQAQDYNGSNAIILDNLGCTYYLLGEYDKAYEIYQRVMKLKPAFPEAFYNYARVLERRGDIEKALYMARHSLSLRFWNISTISKSEVEAYLNGLETKAKAIENRTPEKETGNAGGEGAGGEGDDKGGKDKSGEPGYKDEKSGDKTTRGNDE